MIILQPYLSELQGWGLSLGHTQRSFLAAYFVVAQPGLSGQGEKQGWLFWMQEVLSGPKFELTHAGQAPVHGSDLSAPAGGWSSPATRPQLCMSRCAFHAAEKTLSVFT